MRTTLLAAAALLAAPVEAQHNAVQRRNPGVLWLEPGQHPGTGNPYPDARQNPPAHATPQGVPAGTRSYVWVPRATNHRDGAEIIDGFRAAIGPSSATTNYPAVLYFPEVTVHRTRTVAGHVEPDPTAPPHFVLPEAPSVFGTFGFFISSSNLANPFTLPASETDVVLSARWSRNDGRDIPDTLQMSGDAAAASGGYDQPVFGFVDPQGAVAPVLMDGVPDPGFLNLTYTRAAPSAQVRGSWVDPQIPAEPTVPTSIGAYQGPLATRRTTVAWNVSYGPAHRDQVAIALLNVGPFFEGSFAFLGQTFELDILDPALPLLASAGYIVVLDALGEGHGAPVTIPRLGQSALGTSIGVDFAVFNAMGTAIEDTTQSVWLEINR